MGYVSFREGIVWREFFGSRVKVRRHAINCSSCFPVGGRNKRPMNWGQGAIDFEIESNKLLRRVSSLA